MTEEKRPRVSFVIPNYRGERLLPTCLDSVLSQETDETFEIIVVDDCSDDGSLELLARDYPQVKTISNRKNRGPAAAKNIGAGEAAGDVVAFLDNDVELDSSWLQAMTRSLEGEGVGACASHILLNGHHSILNSTGGLINLLGYAWDRGIFWKDTDAYAHNRQVMYACSAAMMMKMEVFEEIGGFDERFHYLYEDADLGWRINIYGYRVLYEPQAIAHHLLSSTMGKKWLRNLYLYERNRMRAMIKNMEPGTLRMVRREMAYWFGHRMRAEMDNGLSTGEKIVMPLRMAQALAWNLVMLPDNLSKRREVSRHRVVPDRRLVSEGVLCPQIGDPPIGDDPRAVASKQGQQGKPHSASRKVAVARAREDVLGSGWYEKEVDVKGVAFRWTGERATLSLKGGSKSRHVLLRTVMAHPEELTQVSLKINGHLVSTFEVPNQYHMHRIPIPDDLEPGVWELELLVGNPFQPREILHVEDQRTLGVAVAAIEIR